MSQRARIPERGEAPDVLLERMAALRGDDADWKGGRTWSMVYHVDDAHHEFLKKAHNLYFSENALNPFAFRSLRVMEHDVVQMVADMLNAPPTGVGTMTSGGTESLLLAVKTYRDRARRHRPWVRNPNLVVPQTIHPAFDKAAHLFDVKLRKAPVHANWQVDVDAMERLINRNTVGLAASAPQYVTGTIDPIPEIGQIAARRKLPLHVDSCFGGFMQPWLERLGVHMPVWDFRVEGVTSMSADVHKYGYAPKGSSTIVYRDMSYLRHQFFVTTDWSGGIYASPGIPGTRPGSAIAAAWATMNRLGEDGYLRVAEGALEAANQLREGVRGIDGLRVLGLPHSTVVTWAAEDPGELDVFVVSDYLADQGWAVDRQQFPASVHCSVNANNRPVLDLYLADLRAGVEHARAHPELSKEGEAAMYGMMARVPIRGLVRRGVRQVLESLYGVEGTEPELDGSMGDGFVDRLMDRYGDQALDALDQLRSRIPRRGGRGRPR